MTDELATLEEPLAAATLTEDEEQAASAAAAERARLPFSFATTHGVMLEEEGGRKLLYRPGLTIEVLLELQRFLGSDFEMEEVPSEDFQRRLTREYQSGDGAAQRAAEDLGAEYDLSSLADDLADRTDLLAGDDDAQLVAGRGLLRGADGLGGVAHHMYPAARSRSKASSVSRSMARPARSGAFVCSSSAMISSMVEALLSIGEVMSWSPSERYRFPFLAKYSSTSGIPSRRM